MNRQLDDHEYTITDFSDCGGTTPFTYTFTEKETPKHYAHVHGGDCLDIMKQLPHIIGDFRLGNVFKYVWRAGQKDSYLADLKKAQSYLNDLISDLESKE